MADETPTSTITPPATGLAANNIGKAYRGRVVVKDITLTVQRGEVVALMGPNGAGKTSLLNMITGLTSPVQVSSIIDIENIIIEGTIFGFNGGYEDAEVLMPGKGYWLKANSNGIISLSYP